MLKYIIKMIKDDENDWKIYQNSMLETDNNHSNPSSRQSSLQDLETSLLSSSSNSDVMRVNIQNRVIGNILFVLSVASVAVFVYFLYKELGM